MLQALDFPTSPAAMGAEGSGPAPVDSVPKPLPTLAVERLLRIERASRALLAELRRAEIGLAQARAYLAGPGAGSVLGRARVEQLQARRSALLEDLLSHRTAALEARVFPHLPSVVPQ